MPKKYKLTGTMQIEVETVIEDVEIPTEETLRFLIEEDLQNLGYLMDDAKMISFKIVEV